MKQVQLDMHGTKLPVLEAAMLYRFVSLPHPVQLWAYISRSLATKGGCVVVG